MKPITIALAFLLSGCSLLQTTRSVSDSWPIAPPPKAETQTDPINYKHNLEIKTHSGTKDEFKAKEALEKVLSKYDVTPYLFTRKIQIQEWVPSYSSPILTINQRHTNNPDRMLSVFLHEQIHWFFDQYPKEKSERFMTELKKTYPKVPSHKEGGGRSEESTYLHLGVNYYELIAISKYLGEKRARELFEKDDIYPWVCKQVLEKPEVIKRALEVSGLQWRDATDGPPFAL